MPMSGGESNSSGRVRKRSRSLGPTSFQAFTSSLGVTMPTMYIDQPNTMIPPWKVGVPYLVVFVYSLD